MEKRNHPTVAVPEWVTGLRRAHATADEYLTRIERDLLEAAFLLIRARHGRSTLDEPKAVAQFLLRIVQADLNTGRPLDEVIAETEATLGQLRTFRDAEAQR